MCCRARTPKNFQVHANMMIKKKSVKTFFVATTKSNNPHFPHICCFFVAIGCSNKRYVAKMLSQQKRKTFLFRKFFSKILSNVSSDLCHRGVMPTPPMYLHHILKLFLRSVQKSPKSRNKTIYLTHRKAKNTLSKKFRQLYRIYSEF